MFIKTGKKNILFNTSNTVQFFIFIFLATSSNISLRTFDKEKKKKLVGGGTSL